jgi:hypothetical protein
MSDLERVQPAGVLTLMSQVQQVRKSAGRVSRTAARHAGKLTDGQRNRAMGELRAAAEAIEQAQERLATWGRS